VGVRQHEHNIFIAIIAVLHTNRRQMDYHPHVHLAMPASVVDHEQMQKKGKHGV